MLALVVAAVLLAGGVAAVVLIASRSSTPAASTAPPVAPATVVQTVQVTQPAAAATGAPVVTVAAMGSVLLQYEAAYSAEDVDALGSLFAPELVRKNGDDPAQDRAQALSTYQQQFDQLTAPQYTLHDMRFRTGRGEGQAFGTYVIDHAGGTTSGTIAFDFVVRDGQLLIDGIVITPS